jgi:dihydroorotate dehydrogenase electron transfer subunit
VSPQTLPLLRRPFSIHRPLTGQGGVQGFELLYKVVGEGTRRLSEVKSGESIDVLGPLGKGFSCPQGVRRIWVVAGGVGVASLYFLVLNLSRDPAVHVTVFIGGCSAADILCEQELTAMGAEVRVTTEDCTLGETGLITTVVQRTLEEEKKPDMIYGCGPQAMLKAVGRIADLHHVSCQISLESAMACGFGVCLGCAVEKGKTPGAYYHVCTDGPVFDAKDVRI